MGKNFSGDFEKGFARGPQGPGVEKEQIEKEVYQAGRNLGYHLGYNLGFESGYEKGYIEGSTLGYNNGFLAALRLGEGCDSSVSDKFPELHVCQMLQKMINGGLVNVLLTGCAAGEAKALLKLFDMKATVVSKGTTAIF